MKRIAIKLVVFLLLGAVTTVAVAWGCALWQREPGYSGETRDLGAIWPANPPAGWPLQAHGGASYRVTGLRIDTSFWGGRLWYWMKVLTAGWPCGALTNESAWDYEDGAARDRVGRDRYEKRVLPIHPIFPGFLINTLFYAVILWLLWSAPFASRRLIRKRRGRCVRCGYDLRHAEHDVCPECGSS